jgi:hypothetical protein
MGAWRFLRGTFPKTSYRPWSFADFFRKTNVTFLTSNLAAVALGGA